MMPWKLKIVVLGTFLLWCAILWFISFHFEWNKDDQHNEFSNDMNMRIQRRLLPHYTSNSGKEIQVFLASDENSIAGMITAINSIITNTRNPVHFYLVTDELHTRHLAAWIEHTKLSQIKYSLNIFPYGWIKEKILREKEDNPKYMQYAKYFIPYLFPDLKGILVYIDNDVIVQGDIAELANTPMRDGTYGAFSDDCHSISQRLSPIKNTYASYINFNNKHIKRLKMNPTTCTFNTGVFIINVTLWHKANLTAHLTHWTHLNKKDKLYINGGSQVPILIVFYNKISQLDPLWHVRHLGISGVSHYSRPFLLHSKLLHWDGHYKPWTGHSANTDIWEKYFIPDPTGHFKLIRKKA